MMSDSESGKEKQKTPNLWRRMRARRWSRWAIDIGIIVAIVFAISAFQSRHLLGGDDALPSAQLTSLDGSTLSLDELDSRRTLIYFWATWCGACGIQSGAVSALHERADEDLTVISVVMHYDSREAVEKYVRDEGIDYPVYLGTDALAHRFQIEAFPTIYIVDDEGRIRHGLVGYTTRLGLMLRLAL